MSSNGDGWEPRTRLGRKVQNGDITSMEQALNSGLPLKESELVKRELHLKESLNFGKWVAT